MLVQYLLCGRERYYNMIDIQYFVHTDQDNVLIAFIILGSSLMNARLAILYCAWLPSASSGAPLV